MQFLCKISTKNIKNSGKADLPPKFANLQLFPAVTLSWYENVMHANFGKDEWCFRIKELNKQFIDVTNEELMQQKEHLEKELNAMRKEWYTINKELEARKNYNIFTQ